MDLHPKEKRALKRKEVGFERKMSKKGILTININFTVDLTH
jgi:hypothetical protein